MSYILLVIEMFCLLIGKRLLNRHNGLIISGRNSTTKSAPVPALIVQTLGTVGIGTVISLIKLPLYFCR